MSATQREHVIQVPDTPAFEGEITGGGGVPDAPADEPSKGLGWCGKAILCAAALVVAFLVALMTLILLDGYPPDYSAAITGAAGVPSKAASPDALPPLFNLTVHISNPNRVSAYCVPSGTTAAVSYGGAAIGAGSVPVLCAGTRDESEVVVPVWVVGAGDVTLPLAVALQRREAVVDVVIQMPRGGDYRPHLVACSVRVEHGLSPCTVSRY